MRHFCLYKVFKAFYIQFSAIPPAKSAFCLSGDKMNNDLELWGNISSKKSVKPTKINSSWCSMRSARNSKQKKIIHKTTVLVVGFHEMLTIIAYVVNELWIPLPNKELKTGLDLNNDRYNCIFLIWVWRVCLQIQTKLITIKDDLRLCMLCCSWSRISR